MAIFEFNNDNFKKIEQTQFFNEGILERQHLQNALKKQIDVITSDVLIISEEFAEWSDSKRRIDLLGIDKEGNIVVIELKRTETGEHMDLQAIRYASMVSTLTFARAVEIFTKYLVSIQSDLDAENELSNHLGDNREHFASDVKIILVSSDFSKELTTSVMWLNEKGLDIRCYRLIPLKLDSKILIDVQQIIPLPEAESYQIKVREQKEERREALKEERDNTKYTFNGENGLGKRNVVLSVWKQYMKDNQNVSYEKLLQDFPSSSIGGRLFVELEQALEQQRRDSNKQVRYFIGENEVLKIGQKTYVISNQWGKGNIENFIGCARNLGYNIEED
jgi:hypothetical protein